MSVPPWVQALVAPRAVAIVGASADRDSVAARPLRFLRRHGFVGRIYPVNPNRPSVLGERAWPDLASVPEAVEHAYIVTGTDRALAAVEACAAAGVPVATVLADGFADAGPKGAARQAALVAAAKRGGVRLLGPNSLGVINPRIGLALSASAALQAGSLPCGRLTAISQSGGHIGTLLSRGAARGLGFAALISVGNEADLTAGEIGTALAADPDSDAFLLFLDNLRAAADIARFARRAHGAGTPVIAYKLGRSEAGREAARSHTGALTGPDAAADAFLRAHGILRVDQFETLLELPALVIGRGPPRGTRRTAAVVSTTGGGGAVVVDRLGASGIEVRGLTGAALRRLAGKGIGIKAGRLIDVTLAGARADVMAAVLDEAIADARADLVVAVTGSSAQFQPELAVRPIVDRAVAGKPLAAVVLPEAGESLRLLAEAGVANFRTPEACADAVRAYLDWRGPRRAVRAKPLAKAEALLQTTRGARLDEAQSLAVFGSLGIETAAHRILDGPAAPRGRLRFGYPVAVKALSAGIAHKSDIGAVVLNVPDASALEAAAQLIVENLERHGASPCSRFLVQKMQTGVAEVLLGYRRDPEVGPLVTLGIGGVLAEIYRDVATALAPVDIATARCLIGRVKGLATIRGYRNMPKGDVDALARAVAAFSRLANATARQVIEAEINPLIVRRQGAGVVAVDGIAVLA